MATRNWWKDGAPKEGEWWATASRSSQNGGQNGVAVGCGPVTLGLIDEQLIDECVDDLRAQGGDEMADMIEKAAKDLPGFKRTLRQRHNAPFN